MKGREFSRLLYVTEDIREEEVFTEQNLRPIRLGHGLNPKYYSYVLGEKAKSNISK
jgi:sialic acid synthase SpsE